MSDPFSSLPRTHVEDIAGRLYGSGKEKFPYYGSGITNSYMCPNPCSNSPSHLWKI